MKKPRGEARAVIVRIIKCHEDGRDGESFAVVERLKDSKSLVVGLSLTYKYVLKRGMTVIISKRKKIKSVLRNQKIP